MARRVLGFTLLFYLCSIAPFQAGAALAWLVVLFGLVSALHARDSGVALLPLSPSGSELAGLYLFPRTHRGDASSVGRSVVIVERERPELWRDLILAYGTSDEVEILLDRRGARHWTGARTDRDRRSSLPRRMEVEGQGFCVIARA